MKEEIRRYGYSVGADAVGFAAIEDYQSQRSLDPRTIMSGVRSIVVLAYRQLDGALGSSNVRTAMSARIGLIPRVFGSRVAFTAALTELPLRSDPPVQEELCNQCGLCIEGYPAKALNEAGRTDEMKCLKISQPYGIGGALAYLWKIIGQDAEAQKVLLKGPLFLSFYQVSFIGFQYMCFNCIKVCPAGRKEEYNRRRIGEVSC